MREGAEPETMQVVSIIPVSEVVFGHVYFLSLPGASEALYLPLLPKRGLGASLTQTTYEIRRFKAKNILIAIRRSSWYRQK